MNIFIYIFGS